MTLTQLEYFCAVCRYHSITRAAEALFVSQPTISTSIRDLEKNSIFDFLHMEETGSRSQMTADVLSESRTYFETNA